MLKRTHVGRYLMALLASETIPQNSKCEIGPIATSCGKPVIIQDSSTDQQFANIEAEYDHTKKSTVGVSFNVPNVTYMLSGNRIDYSRLTFNVLVTVIDKTGVRRQNKLDDIEAKFLYRLLSLPTIRDKETGLDLKPFIKLSRGNSNVTIKTSDYSDYEGSYTIRDYEFTLDTNECIGEQNCELEVICFDFSKLTPLDKDVVLVSEDGAEKTDDLDDL